MIYINSEDIINEMNFYQTKIEGKNNSGDCLICCEKSTDKPFLCDHYCCFECLKKWRREDNIRDKNKCFYCQSKIKISTLSKFESLNIKETYSIEIRENFRDFGLTECEQCGFWCREKFCPICLNKIQSNSCVCSDEVKYLAVFFSFILGVYLILLFLNQQQCYEYIQKNNIQIKHYLEVSEDIYYLENVISDKKREFNFQDFDYNRYMRNKNNLDKTFEQILAWETKLEDLKIKNINIYLFNKKLYFKTYCNFRQDSLIIT
jgi:hypothetical protein